MKKFLNILFALSALGLIVACSPAGKGNARLKHRVDPVDPVEPDPDPIWDDDDEEILAQRGYFWFGTGQPEFVGFAMVDNKLYAYTRHIYDGDRIRPKHAEHFWWDEQKAAQAGRGGWTPVVWTNKKAHQFTVNGTGYKLDRDKRALTRGNYDFMKFSVSPKVTMTAQIQSILTGQKYWKGPSSYYALHAFYYDTDTERLYCYWCDKKSPGVTADDKAKIKDALDNPNFADREWSVVYPVPGKPGAFYMPENVKSQTGYQPLDSEGYYSFHSEMVLELAGEKLKWYNFTRKDQKGSSVYTFTKQNL